MISSLTSGAETRGGWGIYPPIIWLYTPQQFEYASPPIIWLWCASERRSVLKKSVPILVKTFFLFLGGSSPEFGEKKCSISGEDLFFWSSLNLLTWKKSWSRFILPMLKIGQNCGKVANYPPPPQCSTKICTTESNWKQPSLAAVLDVIPRQHHF